jgi:ABC-2 type transport system ATP-binding protein
VTAPAELRSVSKSFGNVRALDGLDLRVESGERLALLGPNGAGKTTALGLLLGLRRPDAGSVRLFGRDPREVEARRAVGCTPQETTFPSTLRVGEIVDLVRAHYRAPLPRRAVLDLVELGAHEQRQVGGLSAGQRRRLACALAFAGNPALVLLDEPSGGLDVEGRRRLWQTIRESGRTVLLTTHSLEEAEALATRIAILRQGSLAIAGTPAALAAQAGTLERAYLAATGTAS